MDPELCHLLIRCPRFTPHLKKKPPPPPVCSPRRPRHPPEFTHAVRVPHGSVATVTPPWRAAAGETGASDPRHEGRGRRGARDRRKEARRRQIPPRAPRLPTHTRTGSPRKRRHDAGPAPRARQISHVDFTLRAARVCVTASREPTARQNGLTATLPAARLTGPPSPRRRGSHRSRAHRIKRITAQRPKRTRFGCCCKEADEARVLRRQRHRKAFQPRLVYLTRAYIAEPHGRARSQPETARGTAWRAARRLQQRHLLKRLTASVPRRH